MVVNDPVGDMLTRIRNASRARHDKVLVPASRLKKQVALVLKDEGYIGDVVEHDNSGQKEMSLLLKYGPDREPVISGIRRISRPGLRRYTAVQDIPRVLGGMGISILSTSKGVVSDSQARKLKVGGELICTVY